MNMSWGRIDGASSLAPQQEHTLLWGNISQMKKRSSVTRRWEEQILKAKKCEKSAMFREVTEVSKVFLALNI